MSDQLHSFFKQIPDSWDDVLSVVVKYGFVPTLVGGTVREFFLYQKIGKDWDLEISHPTLSYNQDHWKSFNKDLGKLGKTTLLPYDIIRLDYKTIQFEFSPQRKEIFVDALNGHKNFKAEHDFNLTFKEASQRRDFTINAMGIDLKNKKLIDPLEGLKHLREKMLVPCGENFEKDPVRFLRAMRFSLLFKMDYSEQLKEMLKRMDLSYISFHYLWSEMKKSQDPVKFFSRLQEESQNHPELKLPLMKSIKDLEVTDPLSQDSWILSLCWANFETQNWERFFNLSPDQCKKIRRWCEISQELRKIDMEVLKGEFEEIHSKKEFQQVFDWYFATKQILQKTPESTLESFIQKYLQEWSYLFKFELVRDVKHIDPPLRAKYQVWNLCQRI